MDNYGRQLNTRREKDARSVRNNEILLANSVSSRKTPTEEPVHSLNDDLKQIELIAEYFQLKVPFYQVSAEALPERIDLILRPTGIMKRHVRLDGPWWKNADAPMLLTFRGEERLLACFGPDDCHPAEIIENIKRSIEAFIHGNSQFDDITMLCFRWDPERDGEPG